MEGEGGGVAGTSGEEGVRHCARLIGRDGSEEFAFYGCLFFISGRPERRKISPRSDEAAD